MTWNQYLNTIFTNIFHILNGWSEFSRINYRGQLVTRGVIATPAVGPFYVNTLRVYRETPLKRPILLVWEGRLEAAAPEPESSDHTAHPPFPLMQSNTCRRPFAGNLLSLCAYRNRLDEPERRVRLNLGTAMIPFLPSARADGLFLVRFRPRRFWESVNFQFHPSWR